MVYQVWSVDTVTGQKQAILPAATCDWDRVLNAGGKVCDASVTLAAADGLDIRALTEKLRRTLVVEWVQSGADPVVIYEGMILHRSYNPATGIVSLKHADIWWMWDHRLAVDHFAPHAEVTSQTYTNLSLGTIAKKNTQLAISALPIFNYGLPISFPADVAGTVTRTYFGYQLPYLGDVLKQIIAEDGGPDIDFAGRWVGGVLDILMRHGSAASPRLGGNVWEWVSQAQASGIIPGVLVEDATNVVTNSVAIGQGAEVSMLTRSTLALSPVNPATERKSSYKTVSDPIQLAQLSAGDLESFRYPTEQLPLRIPVDGFPNVAQLALGDTVKRWNRDHEWFPNGWAVDRVVGFSGDIRSPWVDLRLQPSVGVL
jgi:hypothetical protein